MELSRVLIGLGLVLIAAGLVWPVLSKLGLGRLPGDVVIQRDGFSVYVPIATSILVSIVISLVLWLMTRWQ